jgi:hypothetical protein
VVRFGLLLAAKIAGERHIPDHVGPPSAAGVTAQPYITPKFRCLAAKKVLTSSQRRNSRANTKGFHRKRCILMLCTHCSSNEFRLSRLHRGDLAQLLLLKYPVRCRDCHERMSAGILFALSLRRAQGPPVTGSQGHSRAPHI